MNQEWIALAIVALTAGLILRAFYRSTLAEPLAGWLLKRGHVKWAMRVRSRSKGHC